MKKEENTENTCSNIRRELIGFFYVIYNTPIVAWRSPFMTSFIVIFTWAIIIPICYFGHIGSYTHPDFRTLWPYIYYGIATISFTLFIWSYFHQERWSKGREYIEEENPNKSVSH